ncbi:MAG: FAD-dependent oxidoreductase [Gemmatimonadetes bacterium]|nr:FAD-dependent oxidoreductase [Gemmatimonadota bacterium]
MTADAAARGIRERDERGTIGLLGTELDPPYNRPPLSKGLWKGDALESIWRNTADVRADLHLGRKAVKLDRKNHVVEDDRGARYSYKKLLLATGGVPRTLPGAPEGIIYYRTLEDYRRVRALATDRRGFGVLGGGFIGTEVAAALRMQGAGVTMIVPEQGLCARVFPGDLSLALVDFYREKGLRVEIGQTVKQISTRGNGFTLRLADGTEIGTDAVVAGLGIQPNAELASQAGLRVDNGIVVDELLRTDDPDISAAGDVANFYNPALDQRIRVEHEDNANSMGKTAGRNMAGAGERYHYLPSFYSDLFELGYEAVGELDARLETFSDWKTPFREGVVYYLESGRVRGVLLWNTWNQVDAARALIAEPGPWSAANLAGRLPA